MQPIVLVIPRGSTTAVVEARHKEAEACAVACKPATKANAFFKSMQSAAIREAVTKTSADMPWHCVTCSTRLRSAI